MTKRKIITCWYRVENGGRKYNHFSHGWTNSASPTPINKEQAKMWEGVTWERELGYLVDGVVKEFSCKVCPYYPNCENDTCEEAFTEYKKRQREKAIESVKEVVSNDS